MEDRKLTVGASARLTADIVAREVVVYGNVKGNLRARDRIEIKKDGSVIGDLTTARIMIEDGAYFKGSIEIDKAGETWRRCRLTRLFQARPKRPRCCHHYRLGGLIFPTERAAPSWAARRFRLPPDCQRYRCACFPVIRSVADLSPVNSAARPCPEPWPGRFDDPVPRPGFRECVRPSRIRPVPRIV